NRRSSGCEAMPRISLMLADVDGTLVTADKILTDRALAAVAALKRRNIRFAITSGRPPRGMAMFVEPLALDTPLAGVNGGRVCTARLVGDRNAQTGARSDPRGHQGHRGARHGCLALYEHRLADSQEGRATRRA